MVRDQNPFLAYLDDHPEADAVALKQLFRILAKRTHPDLGSANEAAFVRLQEAYTTAIAQLARAELIEPAATGGAAADAPQMPRVRVLHFVQRYMALIPSMSLEALQIPPHCIQSFDAAREAARSYTPQARHALAQFHEQFHERRREYAQYPEVVIKYDALMKAMAATFAHFNMPGPVAYRIAASFLAEISPVTDYDPAGPREVRTNRSAAARSALYLMKAWFATELEAGPPPGW